MNNTTNFDIYFLSLPDGDASIIKHNNKVVMIDTGLMEDEKKVISRLQELGITTINYLILTHPDKDHIGNASAIITNFNVEHILQTNYDKKSKLQAELNETILNYQVNNLIIDQNYNFSVSKMKFKVFGPLKKYDQSNDNSLVVEIFIGNTSFLVTGDIEEERINEMLSLGFGTSQVVKLPHHGKYEINTLQLLDILNPKYLVVTASKVDKEIADYINKNSIETYYTPFSEVHFQSNGVIIWKEGDN